MRSSLLNYLSNPVKSDHCSIRSTREVCKLQFKPKGRKGMFYLTTQTQHVFLFYGNMAKDHSDRQRGNPQPSLNGLLFRINSKGSFICTIPQIIHNVAFITPDIEQWLEREIA